MLGDRRTFRYRVVELDGEGGRARRTIVAAVGPLQAALAAANSWVSPLDIPHALDVERQIERTYTVAIEWQAQESPVRQRYAVRQLD